MLCYNFTAASLPLSCLISLSLFAALSLSSPSHFSITISLAIPMPLRSILFDITLLDASSHDAASLDDSSQPGQRSRRSLIALSLIHLLLIALD